MNVAYVAITILAAITYGFAAYLSVTGHQSVVAVAERVQVPQSWMVPFGGLQAAGALGLLVGFAVALIGTAAAVGLVLYYLGAVSAHLRVGDRGFGNAAIFLALTVATLVVGLAHRGPW